MKIKAIVHNLPTEPVTELLCQGPPERQFHEAYCVDNVLLFLEHLEACCATFKQFSLQTIAVNTECRGAGQMNCVNIGGDESNLWGWRTALRRGLREARLNVEDSVPVAGELTCELLGPLETKMPVDGPEENHIELGLAWQVFQ
jgi:hypothetical protein